MEDFLMSLIDSQSFPWLAAFLLGIMTAISPCPLATNISAIGFIGRDVENNHRVFFNGLFYTLGRAFSYTAIALIIFLGADQIKFSGFFQQYGEKIVGPLLIIIGLFMLDYLKIHFPGFNRISSRFEEKETWRSIDAFLLGVVFALAFCPYSGVLYFGMLIPMSVSSPSGLYLPMIFAVATGLPVILFAWIIAYTVSGLGKVYHKLKTFELWFRRVVAILFLIIGVYYIFRAYI